MLLVALVPALARAGEPAGAETRKLTMTDPDITRAVEGELLINDSVSSHLVDVSTAKGIVTLSGSMDSLLSKERAVQLAKTVRGVRAVIDKMKVRPVNRTDEQIKRDIEAAWLRDPATDSYELKTTVKDGKATLKGEVDSWQEMKLAVQVAKSVKGLRGVENNLVFKWTSDRTDHEIMADIQARLESDVWLNGNSIRVKVDDGTVALSGPVGSAIEQTYALRDAWVSGVKEVDTSGLTVEPWLKDRDRRTKQAIRQLSDSQIKDAVKTAFLYDPRVYSFNPEIEVENGIVTLSGTVENLKARKAAERDANNTVGVWRVNNYLKVRPENSPADASIARSIRAALRGDPDVDRYQIAVRVTNQKAYLSGWVNSYFERAKAENLAESVNGVVNVQNNIVVDWTPEQTTSWGFYAPFQRSYAPSHYGPSALHDWQIRKEIENQFFWSPFVDGDDIEVTVDNGVASLNGTVDSRMERGAAVDNAYQGGATSVIDNLNLAGTRRHN